MLVSEQGGQGFMVQDQGPLTSPTALSVAR
jgi:hypothetical protein